MGSLPQKRRPSGLLIRGQQVVVGVGQLGPASGADMGFTAHERVAASQAEVRVDEAREIHEQGAQHGA